MFAINANGIERAKSWDRYQTVWEWSRDSIRSPYLHRELYVKRSEEMVNLSLEYGEPILKPLVRFIATKNDDFIIAMRTNKLHMLLEEVMEIMEDMKPLNQLKKLIQSRRW